MRRIPIAASTAAGAIEAARRAGVSVPGELAAQALLDAVAGNPWNGDRVLPHQLVVRDTSC